MIFKSTFYIDLYMTVNIVKMYSTAEFTILISLIIPIDLDKSCLLKSSTWMWYLGCNLLFSSNVWVSHLYEWCLRRYSFNANCGRDSELIGKLLSELYHVNSLPVVQHTFITIQTLNIIFCFHIRRASYVHKRSIVVIYR